MTKLIFYATTARAGQLSFRPLAMCGVMPFEAEKRSAALCSAFITAGLVFFKALPTSKHMAVQREMLALGEAGYREVTLLGQNIDAYGRDLPGAAADGSGRRAWTFTDLLHYVHDVPGIQRIRFATSHPRSASHCLRQP